MNNLHPHWQVDEQDQEVPVTVTEESNPKPEHSQKALSRKPAALFGIAIVTAFGFTFFRGVQSLQGQLGSSAVTVSITDNGFEPGEIRVAVGTQITWQNKQTIPHIIESDTFCSTDGECLYTPTVFQGDDVIFDVPENIPTGTYTYTSVTSPSFEGTIIVEGGGAPAQHTPDTIVSNEDVFGEDDSSLEEAMFEPEEPEEPSPPPPPPPTNTTPDLEDSLFTDPPTANVMDSNPTFTNSAIPTNPNVVGSTTYRPPTQTTAQSIPQVTRHKPMRQPQTGMGTWIASILAGLSVMLLGWRLRKFERV